jgi:hypothetical protein
MVPGPAVATLAARLPAVPMTSAAQGSQPDRRRARRSASRTSEATISMPSTDSGNAWACQPAWLCSWASSRAYGGRHGVTFAGSA